LERMENIFGWILIYYTGKKPLSTRLEDIFMNVKIIRKRPNLETVIVNIIYAVESKKGLPEANIPTQKEAMMDIILDYIEDLEKEEWSTKKKMAELTRFVAGHGFQLAPFLDSTDDRKADNEKYESLKRKSVLRHNKLSQLKSTSVRNLNGTYDSFLNLPASKRSSQGIRSSSFFSDGPHRLQQLRRRSCLGEMVEIPGYMPWKEEGFEENKKYVKDLDKKHVLDTWTMCYCGGSKIVEKTLDHITKEYKVSLHKETFFW